MKIPVYYHSKDEIVHPVVRAGGDCICEVCGKTYYDHPRHIYSDYPQGRNEFGQDNWALYLIETCEGKKYKL